MIMQLDQNAITKPADAGKDSEIIFTTIKWKITGMSNYGK